MQKHLTDVHKDMSNLNEQFLFDVVPNSEELTFSIYDRAKDYGSDLIGEAVLPVSDLCSNVNGNKRVIQLHRNNQTKSGSVTAEFLFIEPTSLDNELKNINRSNSFNSGRSRSRTPFIDLPLNENERRNENLIKLPGQLLVPGQQRDNISVRSHSLFNNSPLKPDMLSINNQQVN
jgi:hypothetical protein